MPWCGVSLHWGESADSEVIQGWWWGWVTLLKVNTPFWGPRNDKKKDVQSTHGTGKTGKMAKKIPCQGKHRELGNFAKTQGKHRNLVCSRCKFSDSQGKRYF